MLVPEIIGTVVVPAAIVAEVSIERVRFDIKATVDAAPIDEVFEG